MADFKMYVKLSGRIMQSIISESTLNIYNDYLSSVSNGLCIEAPSVKFYFDFFNKYDTPRIRGRFFIDENAIGFALNYNFKNEIEVLRTGRHEIAEWLEYIITKRVCDRYSYIHSFDPIFTNLRKAVARYYPENPQKLVDYVKKVKMKYYDY